MKRSRKRIILVAICALAVGMLALRFWPRYTSITDRFSLLEIPAGGHRYIINDDGIKVVGQEVITYRVLPDALIGTVRRQLERPEVESFRLELSSGRVEYFPLSDAPR